MATCDSWCISVRSQEGLGWRTMLVGTRHVARRKHFKTFHQLGAVCMRRRRSAYASGIRPRWNALVDVLAGRCLRDGIHIHHRKSLSTPSRTVRWRYKPHIQDCYIVIRERNGMRCGRLVRQVNHGRAIHVGERHTYLLLPTWEQRWRSRPRPFGRASVVFFQREKKQSTLFFHPPVFWYVRSCA